MMTREEWLQSLKEGHTVVECGASEQHAVQISEIKKGRIWYHYTHTIQGGVRCVSAVTGWSHDMKHHIIPQNSEEPDNDDNINNFYYGSMP